MRSIFIVILLVLTSGCSFLPKHVWYESHDELISKNHYKKAIEQISIEQPKNRKLIRKVQSKATQHRKSELKKIDSLIALKKWGKARNLLNNLIEFQPWHKSFSSIQEKLNKNQKEELRLLETKQALAQANLLKANILMDDFDSRDHPRVGRLFTNKSTLEDEKQELAKKLFELSIQALSVQDYQRAQKTYAQALALDKNLNATLLSNAISLGVYNNNKNAILSRQNLLVKDLRKSVRDKDFEQVVRLQNILSKPPFEGKTVKKALRLADSLRNKTARDLDSKADNVYREGQINKAIKLWKQAKELAPNLLGIQDKLARAVKVQKKLAKLRQNQS